MLLFGTMYGVVFIFSHGICTILLFLVLAIHLAQNNAMQSCNVSIFSELQTGVIISARKHPHPTTFFDHINALSSYLSSFKLTEFNQPSDAYFEKVPC